MKNGELLQILSQYSADEEIRVQAESGREMKPLRVIAKGGKLILEGWWVLRADGTTINEIKKGEAKPKRVFQMGVQEKADKMAGIKIVNVRPEGGHGRSRKMVNYNGELIPVAEYRKIYKKEIAKK